jgi:hypothetical protein
MERIHTHVDLADDALLQKAGHGFAAVPHMIRAANLEVRRKKRRQSRMSERWSWKWS